LLDLPFVVSLSNHERKISTIQNGHNNKRFLVYSAFSASPRETY